MYGSDLVHLIGHLQHQSMVPKGEKNHQFFLLLFWVEMEDAITDSNIFFKWELCCFGEVW